MKSNTANGLKAELHTSNIVQTNLNVSEEHVTSHHVTVAKL